METRILVKRDTICPNFAILEYIAPVCLAQRNIVTIAESHAHVGDKSRPLLKNGSFTEIGMDFKGLITITIISKIFSSIGVPEEKFCLP